MLATNNQPPPRVWTPSLWKFLCLVILAAHIAYQSGRTLNTVRAQSCGGSCPDTCYETSCNVGESCTVLGPTDTCLYPPDGCPTGVAYGTCCYQVISPIVIDIAGDGYHLTDPAGGTRFAMGSKPVLYQTSWTDFESDDAWLALDRNANGIIDNSAELFGNATIQPVPPPGEMKNGFLALREFDKPANGGNGDRVINRFDAVFGRLRLWQDRNRDGISQPSELFPLLALDVNEIDTRYRESRRRDDHGNLFRYRAKVRGTRQSQVSRWAWDVFLQVEN